MVYQEKTRIGAWPVMPFRKDTIGLWPSERPRAIMPVR